jgi:hypothetical protein
MNIIYGASIVGKIVLQNCKKQGIKIDYFCDENKNKIGTFIDDIEVVHPSKFNNISHINYIIAIIDIKSIISTFLQLSLYSSLLVTNTYETCLNYLEDFQTTDIFVQNVIDMCRFTHKAFLELHRLLIPNIDLVITEKCSLKCKDCANLMQYYDQPQHINNNLLYKTIDRFCDLVDEIHEFRLIGGETFINKDHHIIAKKILSKSNINKLIVYTNGTINLQPPQLYVYQNPKVTISITNYGKLSKNLDTLLKALDTYRIKYYVQTFDNWFDCGKVVSHRNINVYNKCCGKDLLTILYDKLYKCPFLAHATNLHLIPKYNQDYLNIFETNSNELKKFITQHIPEGCCHCNGRIYGEPTIKPFIQITK